MEKLICQSCGKEFKKNHVPQKKYCTIKCGYAHNKKLYAILNPPFNCSTSSAGTAQELRVITDLMLKGYEVFKNTSSHGRFDLVVFTQKKFFIIEVTTGLKTPSKTLNHNKKYLKKIWDILAIVTRSGEIFYQPELPLPDFGKK